MAITKMTKVQSEIEKAKEKLAEQQAKLKELEAKQTELENIEIVDIVRGLNIPLEDLAEVLQSVKDMNVLPIDPTLGQVGPKSKNKKPESDSEKGEETE